MQPANDTTVERNNYRAHLIALVKASPMLWNKKSADFNNRNQKIQKWLDISNELGESNGKIRSIWENLRNQYRRDLKRELAYGIQPKWRFYNSMSFLRSMVRVKETLTGNSTESETDVEDVRIDEVTSPANRRVSPPLAASITERNNDESQSFKTVSVSTKWHDNNTQSKWEQHLHQQQQQQQQQNEDYDYVKQQQRQLSPQNESSSSEGELLISDMSDLVKIEIDTDSSDHELPQQRILRQSSMQKQSTELHRDRVHNYNTATISEACVSTSTATGPSSKSPSRERQQQNKRSPNNDEYHQRKRMISSYATQSAHHDHNVTAAAAADDDDYHFVMSILPSLREISHNRKFPLRMNIMNLIAKELNTDE